MRRAFKKIKKEILEILPAVIFFFFAFNLIVLTDALTTEQYGIRVFSFVSASIAALVIGKVVFLANILPFMNVFSGKPLIYNTLWKTFIYWTISLLVRYLEHLIPLISKYKSLAAVNTHLMNDMIWTRFWAIQIWLVILFFLFAAFQELVSVLGEGKVRQIFFGG